MTKNQTVTVDDIVKARERTAKVLHTTPITYSPSLSEFTGNEIYLKWDNKLRTGCFKERGVVNFLSQLTEKERAIGVCCASAGNHALALGYHCARLKIPCQIFMPKFSPLVKARATQATGAKVTLYGETLDETLQHAVKFSEENSSIFVHPFDDHRIISGQGTLGLEVLEQFKEFDSIIVPVGGGGLISGIAVALKSIRPDIFILGVQSEWAYLRAENKQTVPPDRCIPPMTIADGIGVKKLGELTRRIIEKNVDKMISASEQSLAHSIIMFLEYEKAVLEGAGSAALCGLLGDYLPERCRKTMLVLTGSNIDTNVLARLISRDMGERGGLLKTTVSVPDRPGALRAIVSVVAEKGANILEIYHDRGFPKTPGHVLISLILEVRGREHSQEVIDALKEGGISIEEVKN